MTWNFEQVGTGFNEVLDGPVWDGRGLLFCKVLSGEILRWDQQTSAISTFRRFTVRTTGLAFSSDGELYAAQSGARRIAWYKKDGSARAMTALLNGARHNHPHHLVVDKRSRIWFSDPYSKVRTRGPQIFPLLEHCSVLRLDYESPPREWVLKRMTFDTREPRGLALSPDEATLYVAESVSEPDGKREVRAYPISEMGLGPPRVLHTFGADRHGFHRGAAGLCVDAEGNVIVAAGSKESGAGPLIYVFDPSGRVLDCQPVPADRPTACTFGGEGLTSLFVTTEDGHLFQVRNTNRRGYSAR